MIELKMKLLDANCIPYKQHETDSGFDLKAKLMKRISLGQHESLAIDTGICIELPAGYEGQIRPRSGLAKSGVTAEFGTIDNSYRGEIKTIITNNSEVPMIIEPYDRIAQLVIAPITIPTLHIVSELSDTDRGNKGLGSTGIKNKTKGDV